MQNLKLQVRNPKPETRYPFLLCALCVLCGKAVAGDFQIGPNLSLDSLSLAAGSSSYLVVWRGLAPSPRIAGATVSSTGVVSSSFPISDAAGAPLEAGVQRSTVAHDGANFLVVWADNRAVGAGLRGALVTPQGTVVGGADFLIAPISRTDNLAPLCVFTGSDYLVAWQDAAPTSTPASQIFYARVTAQGAAGAVAGVPSSGGQNQSLEFLVAGPAPEALIVLQDLASDPNVTRAVRLAADNTPLGPPEGVLLFKHDLSVAGFGVPIGASYDGSEYAILSSHSAQLDSSVFKTRLRSDGTVIRPSGAFAEVGQGTTGLAEDAYPRTFCNAAGEFLFVRNDKVSDTAYHLLTKRVAADATDRDPNMPLIDSASQGVLNGAMSAGLSGQFLVVWMDGRYGAPQPARQLSVFGFMVDDTKAGDDTTPYLRAVARAAPTVGTAPLTVSFWPAGQTGIWDAIQWDFGDGQVSAYSWTSHTYEAQGYYFAVLSVIRAGFAMRDFVRIAVDMDEFGGGGGPPQAVGGSLGPVSDGVNTDVVINSLTAALNFAKSSADSLRFTGYFDVSLLPVSMANRSGSLTIGAKTYSFTTDVNGVSSTAVGTTPAVRFGVNRYSGYFALTVAQEDLLTLLAPLGVANETVAKPGKEITVPFSFNFAGLQLDSNVTGLYVATAGKSGRLSYLFGGSGYPGSGYFHVFGAKAVESGPKKKTAGAAQDLGRVHAFTVSGNFGVGGKDGLVKAASGAWRVTLGNYVEDIPVTSLLESSGIYTFKGAKAKTGISGFYYNTRNGAFVMGWKGVPADGADPSGMLLSTSTFWRVDMALSVDADLQNGAKYQGSAYVRLARKKLNSLKWSLR